jgi:hypothetical protein
VEVQLAEDDRTGSLQARDRVGVFVGNPVLEEGARTGGSNAGRVDVVLERDGNAVHGAPPSAPSFRIELPSPLERLLPGNRDERVQRRIVRVDARQARLGQLHRRHLAAANEV